jgi:hypothetical protein
MRAFLIWIVLMAVGLSTAEGQAKMRRLNGREKQALKEFKDKKQGEGKQKKGFLDFKKGGKAKKKGFDRAYSQQSKDVKKRMKRHKRQSKKW